MITVIRKISPFKQWYLCYHYVGMCLSSMIFVVFLRIGSLLVIHKRKEKLVILQSIGIIVIKSKETRVIT